MTHFVCLHCPDTTECWMKPSPDQSMGVYGGEDYFLSVTAGSAEVCQTKCLMNEHCEAASYTVYGPDTDYRCLLYKSGHYSQFASTGSQMWFKTCPEGKYNISLLFLYQVKRI